MMNKKVLIIGLVTFIALSGMNVALAAAPRPPGGPTLSASPNPVLEGNSFTVTVKNSNGNPVSGVAVHFMTTTHYTNTNGQCSFTAPNSINTNTDFLITAQGIDIQLSMIITVRAKILYMNMITVNEGEYFQEYVYDQDGHPVSGALVNFGGNLKLTGLNGYTSAYQAPWVENSQTIIVTASKLFYNQATSGVVVNNIQTPAPVTFSGYVKTMIGGNPIQGAIVSSDTGEQSQPTGSDGYYTLIIEISHDNQDVHITAAKSGYQSLTLGFTVIGGQNIQQDFYLVSN